MAEMSREELLQAESIGSERAVCPFDVREQGLFCITVS